MEELDKAFSEESSGQSFDSAESAVRLVKRLSADIDELSAALKQGDWDDPAKKRARCDLQSELQGVSDRLSRVCSELF